MGGGGGGYWAGGWKRSELQRRSSDAWSCGTMEGAAWPCLTAWRGAECWSDTCAGVHVPVNQGLHGPGVSSRTSSAVQGDGRYSLGQWASERDTLGIPWSSSG